MERARWHHESKLLTKAMKAWNEHHNRYHENKVVITCSFVCSGGPTCPSFDKCHLFIGDEAAGNIPAEVKDVPEIL